ncbi:hypothetical protein MP638_002710 [Amoeboaphelidium occidentale]|nr:hypothetical protein MP638_002710 [Amoeboaphelidium occidentale]
MPIIVKTKCGTLKLPAGVTARQVSNRYNALGVRSVENSMVLAGDQVLTDGSYYLVGEGTTAALSFNSLLLPSSGGSLQAHLVMPLSRFQESDVSNRLDSLVRVVNCKGSTELGIMHNENILEKIQAMEVQIEILRHESLCLHQQILELQSQQEDHVKPFNRARKIKQDALENMDADLPITEKTDCRVCTRALSERWMKTTPCCSAKICVGCYAFLPLVENEIKCPGCKHVLERVD